MALEERLLTERSMLRAVEASERERPPSSGIPERLMVDLGSAGEPSSGWLDATPLPGAAAERSCG